MSSPFVEKSDQNKSVAKPNKEEKNPTKDFNDKKTIICIVAVVILMVVIWYYYQNKKKSEKCDNFTDSEETSKTKKSTKTKKKKDSKKEKDSKKQDNSKKEKDSKPPEFDVEEEINKIKHKQQLTKQTSEQK